jgi:large subunit ribosomal protein L5
MDQNNIPGFQQRYRDESIPALRKKFNYTNPLQVPRLQRIVVNMGMGAAVGNPKAIDAAVAELSSITGQKPVVTRAKKSIAGFKLREGMRIGVCVTLRRERMWEFLERLVMLALPRVRDFRGVSPRAFDGAGNYTLGLKDQMVFPEIQFDKVDAGRGMNVTFVTTAKTDDEGRELLRSLGMPFRN